MCIRTSALKTASGLIQRTARHGKHLSIAEFALGFRLPIHQQVLFLGEGRLQGGLITIIHEGGWRRHPYAMSSELEESS